MSSKMTKLADSIFGVQIIGALILGISQSWRLLHTTTGQSLSLFILTEIFVIMQLMLTAAAHRAAPSRVTSQALVVYGLWIVLFGSNLIALLWNGGYQWSHNDSVTIALALTGVSFVFLTVEMTGIGIKDPMTKSFIAMLCKGMPQFLMAWKILQVGGAGLPLATVIAAHVTILSRIAQLVIAIRESGSDRNRFWLFAGESVNELSWIAVTIAWVIA